MVSSLQGGIRPLAGRSRSKIALRHQHIVNRFATHQAKIACQRVHFYAGSGDDVAVMEAERML